MGKCKTAPEPLLLRMHEAAAIAGCDEAYLRRLHYAGKIKIGIMGKRTERVCAQSLRAYLASKPSPLPDEVKAPAVRSADDLHQEADRADTTSVCYFIGGDTGPIKIGHSANAPSRLASIQTGAAYPLRLLATRAGGNPRERAYHSQFSDFRLHGEWFSRDEDIMAEIHRLNKGGSGE